MTNQIHDQIHVTGHLKNALEMVTVAAQHRSNHVGLILGEPGTGKTVAGNWLVEQLPHAHRICCYANISKKQLVVNLALATGLQSQTSYVYDNVMNWLGNYVDGHIYIIDEANHLSWRHLESMRFLTDEAGASVVLIGTELLTHTLQDRRTATYLAQINSRIGAKTVNFKPIPDDDLGMAQIATYFLVGERFGIQKPKASVAKSFHKACSGYWRLAVELADTCERLMKQQSFDELSREIIESAAVYLNRPYG